MPGLRIHAGEANADRRGAARLAPEVSLPRKTSGGWSVMGNILSAPRVLLEHDHTTEAIQERLAKDASGNHLRDWIYGGIDGTITTFAIVAGIVGAALPGSVVLVFQTCSEMKPLGVENAFSEAR